MRSIGGSLLSRESVAGGIVIAATASRRSIDAPRRDGITSLGMSRNLGEDDRVCQISATFGSLLPSVDSFDAELFGAHPSEVGLFKLNVYYLNHVLLGL